MFENLQRLSVFFSSESEIKKGEKKMIKKIYFFWSIQGLLSFSSFRRQVLEHVVAGSNSHF